MFHDEPADAGMSPEEQRTTLLRDFRALDDKQRARMTELARAMKRHDYATARRLVRMLGDAVALI